MRRIITIMSLLFTLGVMAQQTPGGISGVTVEYWLDASRLMPTLPRDGADVTNWYDVSGNTRHFTSPTAFHPMFVKSAMNYHSAVDFYYLDEDDGGVAANNKKRKMQSVGNFPIDANKSYYVIWVSRLDMDSGKTGNYATVLNLSAGKNDFFGWRGIQYPKYNGTVFDEVGGTFTSHDGEATGYGIGMSVIPNTKSRGSLTHQLYLNAQPHSKSELSVLSNVSNQPTILGSDKLGDFSSNDSFFGEIMEVIVLSRPAGATGAVLSDNEMKSINTYLALKYGLTLHKSSQKDYILSNGTIIYSSSSAGYIQYGHDIFGLVRDDASGLYQKQAMSTDHAATTVYLGELAGTNNENTSTLNDKQAILFGANGQKGTSTYSYRAGDSFQNYTFKSTTDPVTGKITEERLSSIENYKLRVKMTGATTYTVNLAPNKGEWVLVSSDPSFTPANTKIYQIKGGKAENIELKDGDYIGFAFYLKAPGGVTNGLRMWLNASVASTITTNASGDVLTWTDNAGMGTFYKRKASANASAAYLKADERTNYHPTLNFRSPNDYLITDKAAMSVAAPERVSFYTVVNHNFATDRSYFIGFGYQKHDTRGRRPSFGVYQERRAPNEGYGRIGSTGLTNSKGKLFNTGATTIAGYLWNVGQDLTFEFDAYAETVKHTYKDILMNGQGMLGLGSSGSNYYLQGVMPEVIAYEEFLTQDERNRVNSYLGLKYGITLDLDKASNIVNYDFIFSDGSSIWKGNDAIHRDYHHNVASVLRDDDADLMNLQSRSTDTGAIVHMGIGTKLGLDPSLGTILRDKSSITWGHNAGSFKTHSFAGNEEICGKMDSRIEGRIWLVDNENFNQSILVGAHGPEFPYNGANYQVYLLVADSPAKLLANQWDRIVPMAFQNGMHVGNYNFSSKYSYFTFGAKQVGSCEGCEFEGIKTLDFTKTTWPTKGMTNQTVDLGDGFKVKITVKDEGKNMSKGYPRASSLKSLRETRKGGANIITNIEFINAQGTSAAASASFELFDVDRSGRIMDNVEVVGFCNNSPVYPKLSYTFNKPERSRYTINNAGGANAKARGFAYSGNSSYTSKQGRVFVEFETPVQRIEVRYKTTSSSSSFSSNYIGIGPMELYCPAPLPEPNEDGLIFVKQAPAEVLLCEVVDYTFRSINTNCAPKEVEFTDTLPEGMVWVNNSLSAGGADIEDANITGYGTRTLTVKGLTVPGGGSTYTFRASAIFADNAVAGEYLNQGTIKYDRLGTAESLNSTDRLTGKEFTKTVAKDSDRPKQIVTKMTTDKSCFSMDKEIEVTIDINNPNAISLSDMFLSVDYDTAAFTLVSGSVKTSTGLTLGTNQAEDGNLEFEDFKLPAGTSWLKFKIKASNNIADYDVDPATGYPRSITMSYDLISEAEDVCLPGALANANGEQELPFCSICYYPTVVGNNGDIMNSSGFMAVSTLNRKNSDWVSKRGNAFVVLESYNKGLVLTRLTTAQIEALKPVEGMMVYDSTANCLKLYNGKTWGCVVQGCVDE
ncbi:hypothetical protein HX071_16180 [Myroides marinus]|uniref:hypothetical protein n=1 Tax=Myroides marinus TaxID=703342 RepID=UPI00257900ED|nr:hypothetical protein [Myroides marinus]MDM1370770.1 hypothetical protein [Myroides marinus]MDM1503717.1 hypothetical protein [Myroides marinus]